MQIKQGVEIRSLSDPYILHIPGIIYAHLWKKAVRYIPGYLMSVWYYSYNVQRVSDNGWTECIGEQWIGCENHTTRTVCSRWIRLAWPHADHSPVCGTASCNHASINRTPICGKGGKYRGTKKDSTLRNVVTAEVCSCDDLIESWPHVLCSGLTKPCVSMEADQEHTDILRECELAVTSAKCSSFLAIIMLRAYPSV